MKYNGVSQQTDWDQQYQGAATEYKRNKAFTQAFLEDTPINNQPRLSKHTIDTIINPATPANVSPRAKSFPDEAHNAVNRLLAKKEINQKRRETRKYQNINQKQTTLRTKLLKDHLAPKNNTDQNTPTSQPTLSTQTAYKAKE